MLRDIHDLPCWDQDECGGTTSGSFYTNPQPMLFCHKCEKQVWDKEKVQELLEMMSANKILSDIPKNASKKSSFPVSGVTTELKERRVSLSTAEKYRVETLSDSEGNPFGRAYPAFSEGEFIAQKVKHLKEKGRMKWVGDVKNIDLFGQHLFPSGGKFITITEGEEDAMAAYEMLKGSSNFEPPVVSGNYGAKGSLKELKKHWEYINSFDNVIIAFDGDEIGKSSAINCAKLFPGKAKIMSFPDAKKVVGSDGVSKWQFKDACDYAIANKGKEFVSLWFKAERYAPQGVLSFKDLWAAMQRTDLNECVPFPWEGVNKLVYGMITGKMDVFKAPPKIGKTSVLSELIMHIRKTTDHNIGVIFLENTTKEIGLKFCGIDMNLPLDRPTAEIDWEALKVTHDRLSEDDRIMLFDPEDERTVENIFHKITYFVKAHDCKYIFLDHASMLAYTSENNDERKFLDKLFADLKKMTLELNIYLGVVIHVNDDGKTRGSRAPVQLCDRLYSLQRDKLATDPVLKNTTEFIVEENRWGECGLGSKIYYDNTTGRMEELDLEALQAIQEANSPERSVVFDD